MQAESHLLSPVAGPSAHHDLATLAATSALLDISDVVSIASSSAITLDEGDLEHVLGGTSGFALKRMGPWSRTAWVSESLSLASSAYSSSASSSAYDSRDEEEDDSSEFDPTAGASFLVAGAASRLAAGRSPYGAPPMVSMADDAVSEASWTEQLESIPFTRTHSFDRILAWRNHREAACAPADDDDDKEEADATEQLFDPFAFSRHLEDLDFGLPAEEDDLPELSDASMTPRAESSLKLHVESLTRQARLASLYIHLNSEELRRDPWNMSLPVEVLEARSESGDDFDDDAAAAGFERGTVVRDDAQMFLVRDQSQTLHSWDDPPLQTVGEAFDMARQLLEGLVFFHENRFHSVPYSRENIVMDVGLAFQRQGQSSSEEDLHTPRLGEDLDAPSRSERTNTGEAVSTLDRIAFPVRYYLKDITGLEWITDDERDLDAYDRDHDEGLDAESFAAHGDEGSNPMIAEADAYAKDLARLGDLFRELFSEIPQDPLRPLYEFMCSSYSHASCVSIGGRVCRCGELLTFRSGSDEMERTATSALEFFNSLQAKLDPASFQRSLR